jgi:molybdenum cofactor synthesis domain-containing protein
MSYSAAVITVSDGVDAGTRADKSGPSATSILREAGFEIAVESVVRDEAVDISAMLRECVDKGINLVVTTGGTGFAERDVTPEATKQVIEKEAPGLPELMRAAGARQTPLAVLSRGIAGSAWRTLIVNLPGSPKGVKESLDAVMEILPHALDVLQGNTSHPSAPESTK